MTQSIPLPAPKISASKSIPSSDAGVVVVGIEPTSGATSGSVPSPSGLALDEPTVETLRRLCSSSETTGKPMEMTLVAGPSTTTPLIMTVGLGKTNQRTRASLFQSASAVVRKLSERKREKITIALAMDVPAEFHDVIVAGAIYGCEGQHIYQSEPSSFVPKEIVFVGISEDALSRGQTIGLSINQARRLVNEPPTIMDPTEFANRASAMAKEVGIACEVWDEKKLAEERCRAILAVGRGSASPPRLVIFRYNGGGSEAPVAIVGKGVTFDSGGLSIKPSEGMVDMKCDMAGAATVFGVMQAIAKLKVKRNVIGLCGLAENMISGTSYKLGDVIQTRAGKTIEILNTDAEGRVVLADTLNVAVELKPSAIIDLATLTGACMVALGIDVAGLMTNNKDLCESFRISADAEGEPVWELPMFDLYNDKVKSKVADIKNVGEGRWGGAITAAKFLEHFVGEVPWVHIDIAGPAFAESPKPHRDAGATGVMVRSLIHWIENRS